MRPIARNVVTVLATGRRSGSRRCAVAADDQFSIIARARAQFWVGARRASFCVLLSSGYQVGSDMIICMFLMQTKCESCHFESSILRSRCPVVCRRRFASPLWLQRRLQRPLRQQL